MNKRQLIILWAIAIVLGISVAAVKIAQSSAGQRTTDREAGEELLVDFTATAVANITIEGVTDTVTLTRQDDQWVVVNRDHYPARTSSIHEFIRMVDELKVTRGIEAGPSFAPRFGMDETSNSSVDHGVAITFQDADGQQLAKITLGKNISTSSNSPLGGGGMVGRYIRNHDDESGFYVTSQLFPSISYHPETWLANAFISPEKIQAITLSEKDSDELAWTVTRESETAEFTLTGTQPNEVLNTTTAGPLKNVFSYARFEDVVPAAEIEKRTASEGRQTATLITFEGFRYTLTIIPEQGVDNKYLMTVAVHATLPEMRKIAEGETEEQTQQRDEAFTKRLNTLTAKLEQAKAFEGRTYQVSQSTLEPLLRQRSELVVIAAPDKKDPPPTNPKP